MAANRSPNYPAVSLPAAIDLVRKLHDKERRATVTAVVAIRAWGYTAMSGRARGKLSALRKYGLLDGRDESYRVSDRAMAILYPQHEEEKQASVRAAALAPELFSELSLEVGASDDNLVSKLIRKGFTNEGAKAAVASYRETMALVSGSDLVYDDVDDEPAPMMSPPAAAQPRLQRDAPDFVGLTTLRYGLIGPVVVELKVTGGPLTSDQIALLRDYLALHERGVKAAEAAAIPNATTAPQPPAEQSPRGAQD